jgi:hypothetical protein
MDPFLEGEEWEDFHTRFNAAFSEALSPRIEPRYLVRIERRVYVEHAGDDQPQTRRLDVAVLRDEDAGGEMAGGGAAVATVAPVTCILPMPEERRETGSAHRLVPPVARFRPRWPWRIGRGRTWLTAPIQ